MNKLSPRRRLSLAIIGLTNHDITYFRLLRISWLRESIAPARTGGGLRVSDIITKSLSVPAALLRAL